MTQLDTCEFYTMKSGKVRLHKEKALSKSNQTNQTHKQKVTEKGDIIHVDMGIFIQLAVQRKTGEI